MPISNYTELQAAVVNWMHRSDLAARVPEFITLAEARINRHAKVRAMEVNAALVLGVGARTLTLPADYVSPSSVWLETTQPRTKLTPVVPERMCISGAGTPGYWCIDGSTLAFNCPAAVAQNVTFRYRARFQLTDAAPTNSLLTRYPDVYLYGALMQATPFIGHDERIGLWKGMFDEALNDINNIEQQGRSVAVLATDVPTSMLSGRRR